MMVSCLDKALGGSLPALSAHSFASNGQQYSLLFYYFYVFVCLPCVAPVQKKTERPQSLSLFNYIYTFIIHCQIWDPFQIMKSSKVGQI